MTFPDPEFFKFFKPIPGAIGCGESVAIAWLAEQAPLEGLCIDIGTNAGRAALSSAMGLERPIRGKKLFRTLHCVDPVFDLTNSHAVSQMHQKTVENIGWTWVKEPNFGDVVKSRIESASPLGQIVVQTHGLASMDALPMLTGGGQKIAWVFVDADNHQYDLVHSECFLMKDRMVSGGIIAFHDFQNQYLDVERVYRELISTGKFHEIGIPWQEINPWIAEHVKEWTPDNASWHAHDQEHPHFVGALKYIG